MLSLNFGSLSFQQTSLRIEREGKLQKGPLHLHIYGLPSTFPCHAVLLLFIIDIIVILFQNNQENCLTSEYCRYSLHVSLSIKWNDGFGKGASAVYGLYPRSLQSELENMSYYAYQEWMSSEICIINSQVVLCSVWIIWTQK